MGLKWAEQEIASMGDGFRLDVHAEIMAARRAWRGIRDRE